MHSRRPPSAKNAEGWGTVSIVAPSESGFLASLGMTIWVEVNEVDGFVLDVLEQDFEVVAVTELFLLHCGEILAADWAVA